MSLTWLTNRPAKFTGIRKCFRKKESNLDRIGIVHQHDRRFRVLENQ